MDEREVPTGDEFPPEPLRAADEDDTGEPMPEDALRAQEDFDRAAVEVHRELDEGGVRRIALLYLPVDASAAARILLAVAGEFPGACCRYDDGGNWLIFERIGEDR